MTNPSFTNLRMFCPAYVRMNRAEERCQDGLYRHATTLTAKGSCQSVRELAIEISLTSLGSSQTLRRPHFNTEAANRFCSFKDTIFPGDQSVGR